VGPGLGWALFQLSRWLSKQDLMVDLPAPSNGDREVLWKA
jgi:hypothetical protein